ncbi:DoxX family protein [Leptospira vanthielii]|uniref:DoxX family membrane protein n=2 Tax=Leptospira vanthielii TaxID=293085 RepID=A0ABY2NSM3_9LEPT|nr:hypothetical protein [Leptospira vanthielii]EMY71131.1 hypothetical protein LEP1GSC199_0186 [Leptospira vanthielii serovar Holland str. Waz Holland = ATCC 700522]TGM60358.1 hypothetical protein EHQ95_03100 [Leptospira vanthielii]
MNQTNTTDRNVFQTTLRILLGAFLAFAGTGHLTWHRTEFLAQVPTWLPIDADLVVLLSGVVEISLGLSLIFLRNKQAQVGWVVALFFVMIFPGNVSQYINGISAFGLDTDRARLIRLFFQPVLVLWAIWSCGSWQDFLTKRKN